jgi:hypothetical protein
VLKVAPIDGLRDVEAASSIGVAKVMTDYPGDVTVEEEVARPFAKRPHVVLLGAGASRAAFPEGERAGRFLPVMADLIDTVGLASELDAARIDWQGRDFEVLYGELRSDPARATLCEAIEQRIEAYFGDLQLPAKSTLYDRLVLSLRPKDLIATFNWDPFLYDACQRNRHAPLPHVVYLHGNVRIGYCPTDRVKSLRGIACNRCGRPLIASRLLYPVQTKDYSADVFTTAEWSTLRAGLRNAFALTIFGYSAPTSDADAIALMKSAWGSVNERQFEEVEIIDIRPEDELRDAWDAFIHTHHYQVHRHLADSVIGIHPRRSVEALWSSLIDARFVSDNRPPESRDLRTLHKWISPLVDAEARQRDE